MVGATEIELERLRMRLWKARGRTSKNVGMIYLVIGAVFLILAYLTRYIVFEAISIIAIFLGVISVFTNIEPYMKETVGNEAVASPLLAMIKILDQISIKGRVIYLPVATEAMAMAFIPINDDTPLPTLDEISTGNIIIPNRGLLIPSNGAGLLQLYEKELSDIRSMDFNYFIEWMPKVLTDGLKVCEKAEISVASNEVQVRIAVSSFRHLCQKKETIIACRRIGCPLSSVIASALAKNTNRVVYYKDCNYNPKKRETAVLYELGQTLET